MIRWTRSLLALLGLLALLLPLSFNAAAAAPARAEEGPGEGDGVELAQARPAPPAMKLPWDNSARYAFNFGPHSARSFDQCVQVPLNGATGLDFGLPYNPARNVPGAEVLAVADGTLFAWGNDTTTGVGLFVTIRHDNGWTTGYWHLSEIDPFIKNNPIGTPIEQGRRLGRSGTAGTGPHLHLELRYENKTEGVSWDGVTIDGYTARAMRLVSDPSKILNYRGTLTVGNATTSRQKYSPCGGIEITRWDSLLPNPTFEATSQPITSTNRLVTGDRVLKPTTSAPLNAGRPDKPDKITLELLTAAPQNERTREKISVLIGGKPAEVQTAVSLPRQAVMTVDVTPPPQDGPGLFDLTVKVADQPAVAVPQAIRYGSSHVDVALVIDRSGSMGTAKMQAARDAAKLLVDLMQLNDMIGVVGFDDRVVTPFPLTTIALQPVDTRAQARQAIDTLFSWGGTAIGAGLQTGQAELSSRGNPTNPNSIVLLSDGQENVRPFVDQVLPAIRDAGTVIHTVGLGSDADQAQMLAIAAQTGGTYNFAPSPDQLSGIYNTIASTVGNRQTLLAETGLLAAGATQTKTVTVDSTVREATFAITWLDRTANLRLTLRAPDGTTFDPTTTNADMEYVSGTTYAYYRVKAPTLTVGAWQLLVSPGPRTTAEEPAATPTAAAEPLPAGEQPEPTPDASAASSADELAQAGTSFALRVTARSNLTLQLLLDQASYLTTQPMDVVAMLSDDQPLRGATMQLQVLTAAGAPVTTLALRDDGNSGDGIANDGVYGGGFLGVRTAGSYRLVLSSSGTSSSGQPFTRQVERAVFIANNPTPNRFIYLPLVGR
ncbi:MAG: VWA domain-containing protein [Chloroflexaceae bacterium]|jgi:murein DD-endopeptidase MepM/ murein hydrolase activator NlpD|nr:VWA domain-containing protein [Chloroflexaceae bacterium]